MRLPWNRKYLEISFHIILTVLILAAAGGLLFHLSSAKNVILQTAGRFLAVFAPVFWALFFSLLLEPMVSFWQKFYEKRRSVISRSRIRNRRAGAVLAYISIFLFLFLLSSFLAHKIGDTDIRSIAAMVREYIRRAGDVLVLLNLKLAEIGILSNVEGVLHFWTEQSSAWIESKLLTFTNSIPRAGGGLLDILIGLAAAFYFLVEKERMLSLCSIFSVVFLGEKITGHMRKIFQEIYTIFAGYLSGQMLDAGIMTVLFSGAFLVVGLPHGVLLGILSGFSNIIPYFGAVTAFVLAAFAGLFSGIPVKAVYASVIILLLQQVDSLYIVPKVVGRRLELHPVLVLLSLAVFGRLFGFWGLLFAVPLGALCKTIVLWLYERKRN